MARASSDRVTFTLTPAIACKYDIDLSDTAETWQESCVCACMCYTVRALQRGTTSEFTFPEPRPVSCMALTVRFEASEQYQNNANHAIGSPAEPEAPLLS